MKRHKTIRKNPVWAIPALDMTEEQLRFAIEAEDILSFMHCGFTREQHIATFKPEHQTQAATDWDTVLARLEGDRQ